MRTVLAGFTFRTEACQVEWTQFIFLIVLQSTVRAQWTEASIVMRTWRALRFRVDVEVQAVVAVRTCLGACVVGTFGHATQIILVQELARLTLLAEAAQPVLANKAARSSLVNDTSRR